MASGLDAPGVPSALEQARVWVRGYLAQHDGCATAADVLAAGLAAGHAERTLRRAAGLAGVLIVRRQRWGGGTDWVLPASAVDPDGGHIPAEQDDHEPDDAAEPDAQPKDDEPDSPPRSIKVPIVSNTFGYASSYVQVSDAQAASHWDYRVWHSPH